MAKLKPNKHYGEISCGQDQEVKTQTFGLNKSVKLPFDASISNVMYLYTINKKN